MRRIDVDLSQPSRTFMRRALAARPGRLRGGRVPCFGKPIGIVVNDAPDRSVRFDLDGRAAKIRSGTRSVGAATLSARDKPLPKEALDERLSGRDGPGMRTAADIAGILRVRVRRRLIDPAWEQLNQAA